MATRTVSAAGGDWNLTSTWVGGVIPTTSDDIVADATSGNLTVNVNVTIQFANFTGWTNTLTINSGRTCTTTGSGSTTTFASGMSYSFAGTGTVQGRWQIGNNTQTYNMLGTTPIPHLGISSSSGTVNLGTNLYIVNFQCNNNKRFDANAINVSGSMFSNSSLSGIGLFGTSNWNLTGSGIVNAIWGPGPTTRIITVTGDYSTYGIGFGLLSANTFNYTSGTAGTTCNINHFALGSVNAPSNTINVNQPNAKLFMYDQQRSSAANATVTLNLTGPLTVDSIQIQPTIRPYTTDSVSPIIQFLGNSVNANVLTSTPGWRTTSAITDPPLAGSQTFKAPDLIFDYLYTHTINKLLLIGTDGTSSNPVFKSDSAGNQVSISLGSQATTAIAHYDFTDVNAINDQIVAISGTLSNTTNITTTYPSGGTGGGESAYTYFS
jgi:hypothetical protein